MLEVLPQYPKHAVAYPNGLVSKFHRLSFLLFVFEDKVLDPRLNPFLLVGRGHRRSSMMRQSHAKSLLQLPCVVDRFIEECESLN